MIDMRRGVDLLLARRDVDPRRIAYVGHSYNANVGALLSGYLWAFLQDVPLTPGDYFRQLAASLRGQDFVFLALKQGRTG